MRRTCWLTGIIFSGGLLVGWMGFTNPVKLQGRTHSAGLNVADSAEINYQNFCGGCHGEKMDAFVDRKWKHGSSKEDMFKAIKLGYAEEGMPAFDSAFSDKAINELADYIVKGVENVKRYQFQDAAVKENYFSSESFAVKLDTVVKNIKVPWGMAFLPGGAMLVTERGGTLYRKTGRHKLDTISGLPPILSEGQGGLMDIVLHPQFATNKLIYLSYAAYKKTDSGLWSTTAVMRARLEGNRLAGQTVIFEALPYSKTRHHYGSRMVFGRDGKLYFSVGERGNEKENPQSIIHNDLGKIHRINDDGSIPADNPFVQTSGASPSIYSYGQRNPQGLLVYPPTGELWENEHGPRGGDELNIIKKGANYGWPVVTYGINYNGKIIATKSVETGIQDPLTYWIPSIGPSGMAFVTGSKYPAWKGNLLVGSLRFKYLARCIVKGGKVVKQEMLLKNIGRLRDVRMGPDGYIYVAVENPGYVFRLLPVAGKKA
ncbi:MAG: PQQ-dependent sugar dehydrogenase [Chitinophagaceae bacterium]